jgi:hypothetical protein
MVRLTYTLGCFFLTPIVVGMHLVGGVPESPSGWSTSAIWVGGGVAGGAPVSRLIGGGGEGVGCIRFGGGEWVCDGVFDRCLKVLIWTP